MFYLDTSAAVKLLINEPESMALYHWLERRDRLVFSSDLLRTELLRVVRRKAPERMASALAILDALILIRLPTEVFYRAGMLELAGLGSLDSLHLAAALELGDELSGMVTYDHRLADAARSLGIEVVAPA